MLVFLKIIFRLFNLKFKDNVELLNTLYNSKLYKLKGVNRNLILPLFNSWTLSPDSVQQLIYLVRKYKPKTIVELGSGLSTIVIASILKDLKLNQSMLISFDESEKYLGSTKSYLNKNLLEEYVSLNHCPLENIIINNKSYNWYKFNEIILESRKIDLLIVDGPISNNTDSRYPAINQLFKYFNNSTLIFVDDSNRENEKRIIQEWQKEYKNNISLTKLNTVKGNILITFSKNQIP